MFMGDLERCGIRNGSSFHKDGITGWLDFPSTLRWEPDGALELAITTNEQKTIRVWFWVPVYFLKKELFTVWFGIQSTIARLQ